MSVGYRYRNRTITTADLTNTFEQYTPNKAARGDCAAVSGAPNPNCTFIANGVATTNTSTNGGSVIPIHEQWGLFGLFLQPANNFRMNVNVDTMYADRAYTRISPRQLQHYRMRANYKPKQWMNFSGAFNIFESRNNVATVNYLQHARDYSLGASITPSERWGVDLGYSYQDVYSRVAECYVETPTPAGAGACAIAGSPYLLSDGAYNQPTQFGSIGINLSPIKRVHTDFGYRMSAVNGNDTRLNVNQVPGSLQSQYQQPYGNLAFDLAPQWTWKANWNYYGYGEGSPIGPTSPRSFRGNVYTLGVKYAY